MAGADAAVIVRSRAVTPQRPQCLRRPSDRAIAIPHRTPRFGEFSALLPAPERRGATPKATPLLTAFVTIKTSWPAPAG
ncbi:MAG: hypothetical protein WDO69_35210 [Pseudomonadota bacterium]